MLANILVRVRYQHGTQKWAEEALQKSLVLPCDLPGKREIFGDREGLWVTPQGIRLRVTRLLLYDGGTTRTRILRGFFLDLLLSSTMLKVVALRFVCSSDKARKKKK
jgi:hypothetical protein